VNSAVDDCQHDKGVGSIRLMMRLTHSVTAFLLFLALGGCGTLNVGDKCETYRSSDCKGDGAMCLAARPDNYCTIPCKAPTDCPAGFKCEPIVSTTLNGKGEKVHEKEVNVCVKP
jgi:hypothetical protein